jgi:hypothetical protein
MRLGFSAAIWAMAVPAWAQKTPPPPPPPAGTVTGHVIFAETQQPARFAEISLVRKPDAAAIAADKANENSVQEAKTPLRIVAVSGRSGLDGSFAIRDVPPGDFYAIARLAGYVVPIGRIADEKAGRDLDTVLHAIPVVHVAAEHSTEIDLTLHRGAVIAGRLQYEDGSPVVEMDVRVEPAEGDDQLRYLRPSYLPQALDRDYPQRYVATSDDQGHYRIVGLPPGKYVVTTELQTSGGVRLNSGGWDVAPDGGREVVTMFAPVAFHKTDAKVFEVKGAEELDDADVRVELTDLHTVKGAVLAKEDRHAPNQCYLRLTSQDDKQFRRSSRLQSDGTYRFGFVPPGTYTITALAAADLMNPNELDVDDSVSPQYIRRYLTSQVSVIVGEHDVTAEDLLLVESKPTKEKD